LLQRGRELIGREDDAKWPKRNKDGRQELEIRMGNEHISFEVLPHNTDTTIVRGMGV